MDLNNSFEVDADRATAWIVLNDVERIAPCLPGAQLQEIDGDHFTGLVKVKVGPITAQYKGQATFVERDEAAGKVVLKADGRDTRGAGNANARITATLHEIDANRTRVDVHTDLSITGKVAQFGRGVMADVSAKLMGQFADNLKEVVAAQSSADQSSVAQSSVGVGESIGAPSSTTSDTELASTGPRRIDSPEVDAVDLLDAAGASMFKRLIPAGAAAVVLFVLQRVLRARRG